MFGRAKASLGLVKTAPCGSKKKATAKRGPRRPMGSKNKVKRGPGRLKRRSSAASADLGDLVTMVKELQRERDEAVAKLERIKETPRVETR